MTFVDKCIHRVGVPSRLRRAMHDRRETGSRTAIGVASLVVIAAVAALIDVVAGSFSGWYLFIAVFLGGLSDRDRYRRRWKARVR